MTLWQQSIGNIDRTRTLLTGSNVEILSAEDGMVAIAKIRLVNTDSSARTVDLDVYDGTTHKYLLKGYSIAANSYHEFYDESLAKNESLYALASVTDVVWIHVLSSLSNKPK